jgi:hypothetical protein
VNPIRSRYSPRAADLDRFINEQNINRYRKLLDPGLDEAQRSTILRLLETEFETLFGSRTKSYPRGRDSLVR